VWTEAGLGFASMPNLATSKIVDDLAKMEKHKMQKSLIAG